MKIDIKKEKFINKSHRNSDKLNNFIIVFFPHNGILIINYHNGDIMQKTRIVYLMATLAYFSAQASDTKEKQLTRLKDAVAHTNFCAFKLFAIENSRTKSDSPSLSKTHDKIEQTTRRELRKAIKNEFTIRREMRKKWPLFEELDTMPTKKPKTRAKL